MKDSGITTGRLVRLKGLCEKTSMSRSSIYEAIATGEFPRPIKVGPRASAWLESEVDAWIEERVRERDGDNERGAA